MTALGVTNLEVLMGTRFVRRVVLVLLRKLQLSLIVFGVWVDPALTDLQEQVRGGHSRSLDGSKRQRES